MRLRWLQSWTWVKALAVLGVLMHAGLTVRHAVHATQLAASDFALVICHGDGTALTESRLPVPDDPAGDIRGKCPVCNGAIAGAAVLPAVARWLTNVRAEASRDDRERQRFVLSRCEVPRPGRGPPVAYV